MRKSRDRLPASMPRRVVVGSRIYRIVDMDDLYVSRSKRQGEVNFAHGEIAIWGHLRGPSVAETLLHELFHCCYYSGDLEDDDTEEKTVSVLSHQMIQVMRDNPELIRWMQKQSSVR